MPNKNLGSGIGMRLEEVCRCSTFVGSVPYAIKVGQAHPENFLSGQLKVDIGRQSHALKRGRMVQKNQRSFSTGTV